jgi:hypothetical protein
MRFLKKMKDYSGGKQGGSTNIMLIILAFCGGIAWLAFLIFSGIIPIK